MSDGGKLWCRARGTSSDSRGYNHQLGDHPVVLFALIFIVKRRWISAISLIDNGRYLIFGIWIACNDQAMALSPTCTSSHERNVFDIQYFS